MSQSDFIFVKSTLAEQLHKLELVASDPVSAVALDLHIITVQHADNADEKVTLYRAAKSTGPRTNPIPEPPHALRDHSCTLNLSTRRHSRSFVSHGFTLEKWTTDQTPVHFEDLSWQLHDVVYYRALDHAKFLKQPKDVFSKTVDGQKQASAVLEGCIRSYVYDSNDDTWEPANRTLRSYMLAYCKRVKTIVSKEFNRQITSVLSVRLSKKNN